MAFGSKQKDLFASKAPKHKPIAPTNKRAIPKIAYYAVAAIVIIAIVAYYLVSSSSSGVYTLSSNATLQLAMNKSVLLQLSGSSQPVALQMVSSKNGYTFYLSKVPILSNPIYSFTLTKGEVINLSSTGQSTADLRLTLVSASNTSATVQLTPVPTAFGVRASSVQVLNTAPGAQLSTSTTTVAQTTTAASTTTVASSASTTVASTTTVSSGLGGSYTEAQVMTAANQTEYGLLMTNYNNLYVTDRGCTSMVYNNTYANDNGGAQPTGPADYLNASKFTPYGISYKVSFNSGTEYTVVYSADSDSSFTSGPILTLVVNANSGTEVSATFSGILAGDDYTSAQQAYQQANIGVCGAYV